MESGKLESAQRALEQWVQQHPKEVRRLQEQAKPLAEFLNSSEWDAFCQPAKHALARPSRITKTFYSVGQINDPGTIVEA
jgi:hypothetical protein